MDTKIVAHFYGADGTDRVLNMSSAAYKDGNLKSNLEKLKHDFRATKYTYFIAND